MSKDLLSLIEDRMPEFSKGQKLIGKFIVNHYDKAAFMTASKLGTTVGVSESTVVRFAAELGYDGYPDMQKSTCTDYEIRRYRNRISQPLLDRMDLCVKVEKVHYQELEQTTQEESSESIRERVVMAHKRQRERYEKEGFFYNSQIPAKKIATFCALKKDEKRHMQQIYETLNLSVRSYHKILKTARTIADIEGSEEIRMEHLHEAICYRSIDSNFWERRR